MRRQCRRPPTLFPPRLKVWLRLRCVPITLSEETGKDEATNGTSPNSLCRFLTASFALAQRPLAAVEAKGHVGETATVCGDVGSTRYAARARGKPTFINLDKPYPDQVFTVLIWELIGLSLVTPNRRTGASISA